MLDLAARAALRAEGDVEPNPMVGAVLVRDGRILGIGHHRIFGGPHAEREALASARGRGQDPRGAVMYVTLEPCAHKGKQPACTEALIQSGVSRVVCAREDPGGASSGGASVLRDAGIEVEFSSVSRLAMELSEPFVKRATTGLPWVIAKWAQTIDGRVGTRTGESQWISNERSRGRVHRLRARVDAILTGVGTVIGDDPMLTARGVRRVRRTARRVVADTYLAIEPTRALVRTAREAPTIIACEKGIATAHISLEGIQRLERAGVEVLGVPARGEDHGKVDIEALLRTLAARFEVSTVLVEAGPGLLGTLFSADLIDEAIVYLAPTLLGDDRARSVARGRVAESLSEGRRFRLLRAKRLDDDLELRYRRTRQAPRGSGGHQEAT